MFYQDRTSKKKGFEEKKYSHLLFEVLNKQKEAKRKSKVLLFKIFQQIWNIFISVFFL